jgi:zinc transporter, ZIP family
MGPSLNEIWAALAWGAVSSVGLLVGPLPAGFPGCPIMRLRWECRSVLDCCWPQYQSNLRPTRFGLPDPFRSSCRCCLGQGFFSAVNAFLARFGAAHRKRCGECTQQASELVQPASGVAIALGTGLDAVPDVLVLGLALRDKAFPLELVIALSVSNLPEALSGTAGMRTAGRSYRYIFLLWSAVAIGATLAIAAGYSVFGSLGQSWPPRLQAFGAGALLATTAETMIPEAFHNSPLFSGFLSAIGFCALLLVDAVTP